MDNLIYKGLSANLPATRNATSFYLCTDTKELYFGETLYTESVRFYTGTKPATPAQGVLYVDTVTGAGDAWNGTAWVNVIKAYATEIDEGADNTTVPTSGAVKEYVDGQIDALPAATDYTVEIATSTPAGVSKRYTITQAATGLNTNIDIPKDMVVSSGTVETKTDAGEWGEAGTYLHLVLANADSDDIYINVGDLIEYVTSGSSTGDMVVVTVDADHKVTATITDGTITLAKLAADVQAEIGKAHTHTNKDVLDGITAGKVAAWDAAEQNAKDYADGLASNYDAAGAAAQALADAKEYTDGKDTAMNTRVQAVETAVTVGSF